MLKLIPAVKELQLHEGYLRKKAIFFETCPDPRLEKALKKLPCEVSGVPVTVVVSGDGSESYSLTVEENAITIRGESAAGAFYGIQTLRQLFRHERVPCLHIQDQPDFSVRGWYHDITRGRIPTVDTLKSLIDDMAYYKLNQLQLYVEHVFPFRETADLVKKTGCITAEELKELEDYCEENFIEFIPSLSTFGHMYEILNQPQYKHLAILDNYQPSPNFWTERMSHHTVNPLKEGSLPLVDSLIGQYLPLFKSNYFNICCDETFDLDRYLDCDDPGKVYADFVKQIIATVRSRGKDVMMWADILLKHPEVLGDIPEDTVFLNWKYIAQPPEEIVQTLAKMGKKQIVCPGNTTWNRLCENVEVEEGNISAMARYGKKYGALGVLNTGWGDWGNPCSLELGMYGLVLGAEKSWSVDTPTGDALDKAVDMHLYAQEGGMQLLRTLSQMHRGIIWKDFVRAYLELRHEGKNTQPHVAEEDLAFIQKTYLQLKEQLGGTWEKDSYRAEMLSCAEGLCVIAELSMKMAGIPVERLTDTKAWVDTYCENWLARNKQSELSNIRDMFLNIENR